ncbi:hypothetical protein QJS10_CPA05g00493 [Acorus calamus]|uniref:Uncharacterized protein n=1 Tax=Acorus calamus TaxID=4465 RepID=A0AAV9EPS2_ACOCL|nr:hypothetical protein QJS10_CPA05g00493 [Acorus calamus]
MMTGEDPDDLAYGEGDDLTWDDVDEALGASSAFEGYSGRDFGSSSSRNARGKEVVDEMPLGNIGGEIQEDEVEWLSDEELDEEHGVACDHDDEDHEDIIESRIQDLDTD